MVRVVAISLFLFALVSPIETGDAAETSAGGPGEASAQDTTPRPETDAERAARLAAQTKHARPLPPPEHWSEGRPGPVKLANGEKVGDRSGYMGVASNYYRNELLPAPISPWHAEESGRYRELALSMRGQILLLPPQLHARGLPRSIRYLFGAELERRALKSRMRLVSNQHVLANAFPSSRHIEFTEATRLADDAGASTIIEPFVGFAVFEEKSTKLALIVREYQRHDGQWRLLRETQPVLAEFSSDLPLDVAFDVALGRLSESLPWLGASRELTGIESGTPPSLKLRIDSPSALEQAVLLQIFGALTPETMSKQRQTFFARSLHVLKSISDNADGTEALVARAYAELGMASYAHELVGDSRNESSACLYQFLKFNVSAVLECSGRQKSDASRLLLALDAFRLANDFELPLVEYERVVWAAVEDVDVWQPYVQLYLDSFDRWKSADNRLIKSQLDAKYPIEGFSLDAIETTALLDRDKASELLEVAPIEHYRQLLESHSLELYQQFPEPLKKTDELELLLAYFIDGVLRTGYKLGQVQAIAGQAAAYSQRVGVVMSGHPVAEYLLALSHHLNMDRATDRLRAHHREQAFEHAYRAIWWEEENSLVAKRAEAILEKGVDQRIVRPEYWQNDFPVTLDWRVIARNGRLSQRIKWFGNYRSILKKHIRNKEPVGEELRGWFTGHPGRDMLLMQADQAAAASTDLVQLAERQVAANPQAFEPYRALFDVHVKLGDLDTATDALMSYPAFVNISTHQPVVQSNRAAFAGIDLQWSGRSDLAKKLFEVSARYGSGSAVNLIAEMRLAQLDGDLMKMAQIARYRVDRYADPGAIRHYLGALLLMGGAQEVLKSVDVILPSQEDMRPWMAALAAQRSLGWRASQTADWLVGDHLAGVSKPNFAHLIYYLRSVTTDRAPEEVDIDIIRRFQPPMAYTEEGHPFSERHLEMLTQEKVTFKVGQSLEVPHPYDSSKKVTAKVYQSHAEIHILVDQHLKRGHFDAAYKVLQQTNPARPLMHSHLDLVNQYVWAYYRVGEAEAVRKALAEVPENSWKDSHELAAALLAGLEGDVTKAVRHLKVAMATTTGSGRMFVLRPYRLAQTLDILWEETQRDEYRQLALEWARNSQYVEFYLGWPYALSAKMTEDQNERLDAATKAMFLDPQSFWLNELPEEVLSEAEAQLARENPFMHKPDDVSNPNSLSG